MGGTMSILEQIIGTFAGRWYMTLFGIGFLSLALPDLGARKTLAYSIVAIGVGVLAENGSVRFGIPYGYYAFDPTLRGREIWVGDVPLMVSLSYTFMAYFAFGAARLLVSGPYRTRSDARGLEFAVAVMAAVWVLWIVDPVSRLGEHFFLGYLFRYLDPGFWFGLHVQSQLGFTLTSIVLIGCLTWFSRDEPDVPTPGLWQHPRFGALLGYLAQPAFMAGTALWVASTTPDRIAAVEARALGGAFVLIFAPAALMTAVYWRSLGRAR